MGRYEGKYDLIAFDMDETLLTTGKTIGQRTLEAIHRAEEAGKIIAIATGRPLAEMLPYEEPLSDVRWRILESGGMIYDTGEKKILERHTLAADEIPTIVRASEKEDVLVQVMSMGRSVVEEGVIDRMEHWKMEAYQALYRVAETQVPDIRAFILGCTEGIEKINLYHTSREASRRTSERLSGLSVERVYAEETSLELSPAGVDKGAGLEDLCRVLDVPISRAIAVGDADNDLEMIRKAGLGVAMGNANRHVKEAADVEVADNNHDGCAEAIERYLLGEE